MVLDDRRMLGRSRCPTTEVADAGADDAYVVGRAAGYCRPRVMTVFPWDRGRGEASGKMELVPTFGEEKPMCTRSVVEVRIEAINST